MSQRLSIIAAILLVAHTGFVAAQERFELTVPGTTTRSTAELTDTSLSIEHQGKITVYARDVKFDEPDYLGFTSAESRQIILWPTKGMGSMQVAEIPRVGTPQFRKSQMEITPVAAPGGAGPMVGGPAAKRVGLVDTARSYRLTNDFLAKDRSLATDAGGDTAMEPSEDVVQQAWYFVAAGADTFRLTNVALGDGFSLTAQGGHARPIMERTDPRSKAQLWRLTREGAAIRLTNEELGVDWSLDNEGGGDNAPILQTSGNFSGQLWTFTELATVVGTWQTTLVGTNQPAGITVEIGSDLARNELTFRQTESGKADLAGVVQLVGDRLAFTPLGAVGQEYLVTLKADRIDFRDAGGKPTGFFWRRIAVSDFVGTWQEHVAATNKPSGIAIEILNDLSFRQTEPGKPDRGGIVQLAGDRLLINHAGAQETLQVTLSGDRVDFRALDGKSRPFFWRKTAAPPLVARPGNERMISRKVVPNSALDPVTIELANSHSEELWILVRDLRDATKEQRLKIPAGKSAPLELARDAGASVVEVWEITTGLETKRVERVTEVAPKQLYDISVYELIVQSVATDATRKGAPVEDVTRSPKSVGLIDVPPGDRFKGGKTDIYTAAKRQQNPGAVGRIDPEQWNESSPDSDPLKKLLKPRR